MTTPRGNLDLRLLTLLLLMAAGVVTALQLPGLFGDPRRQTSEYAANREKIAAMTEQERQQVKRRADRYFHLPEQERQSIRKLHADLQKAPDAERLRAVMKQYNQWLTSLSQQKLLDLRGRLAKAGTAEEKVQIVKDVQAEQARRKADEEFVSTLDFPQRTQYYRERDPRKRKKLLERFRSSTPFRSGARRMEHLSSEELDAVTWFIADCMALPATRKEELKPLNPHTRHLKIMVLAMNEQERRRKSADSNRAALASVGAAFGPAFPVGLLNDPDLRGPVEQSDLDPGLKERLLKATSFRRFRAGMLSLIGRSIFHERRELRGNPTDEQLNEFFKSLDRNRQDEHLTSLRIDKKEELKRWYLDGGDDAEDYREFRRVWSMQFFRRFGGRRPPSQFGPRSKRSGGNRSGRSGGKRPPRRGERPSAPPR